MAAQRPLVGATILSNGGTALVRDVGRFCFDCAHDEIQWQNGAGDGAYGHNVQSQRFRYLRNSPLYRKHGRLTSFVLAAVTHELERRASRRGIRALPP